MHELEINGITVKYPFIPYEVQKHYMQSVIRSLENSENAALESPTGTGKTLCLLCSTLGWIEHCKKQSTNRDELSFENSISNANSNGKQNRFHANTNDVPLVIYASRTHSQLLQAMKELKRSAYGHMKAGVVASRDHLCIHPKLKTDSNSNKILKCKQLRSEILEEKTEENGPQKTHCTYYDRYKTRLAMFQESTVLDIEDLVRIGKKLECCPYFTAKHIAEKADIVFMPYNYLLDPRIREINQIDLRNAIVILDEAHNVAKICEDFACTKITSTKISIAVRDTQYILNSLTINGVSPLCNNNEVEKLLAALIKLKSEILKIEIKSACLKDSYPGGFIFELLAKVDINEENQNFIIDLLQRLKEYLLKFPKIKERPEGIGLQALLNFLRIAYSSSAPELRERVNRAYKVYIEYESEKENETKRKTNSNTNEKSDDDLKNRKIINFWCFSAEFGMNYLQRKHIRCLILTSGTLSPLDSLINELGIPIPITLSNRHVINNWQIFGKIIEYGPDNRLLNSNYENRATKQYMLSLGKTILELSKVIPEGLLVFFASYSVMDNCVQFWESNGIYCAIDKEKRIFMEPRTKNELRKRMTDYYAKINEENSTGAIFMAVLRGKVSEGLDFADMYGRAVIITGLPFGPIMDPKVILKKKYLDDNQTRENKMLSGWDWYALDAVRAVNQAIGRVIRHKDDYGAIFLCDNRFLRNQKNISSWIKNELTSQQLDESVKDLQQFYEQAKQSLPKPTPMVPKIEFSDDEEDDMDTIAIKDELYNQYHASSDADDKMEDDDVTEPSSSKSPIISPGHRNNSFNGQVTVHRKKLRFSDQNENGECSSDVVKDSVKLNPILKNMEDELGTEMYQQLVQIWSKYDADGNYESYRDSLFDIFGGKKWIYNLKGCLFLTKPHHRVDLDKDIAEFIQGL